jgi:hypothetical protein
VTSILADAVREGQELAGRDMVERAGGATFEPDEPPPATAPVDLPEEPEIEAEPPDAQGASEGDAGGSGDGEGSAQEVAAQNGGSRASDGAEPEPSAGSSETPPRST